MTWLASTASRAIRFTISAVTPLIPRPALAQWGRENWGEMVWSERIPSVPSLSIEGRIALAIVLLVVLGTLLARRSSGARP
jgi:hypothetical protein